MKNRSGIWFAFPFSLFLCSLLEDIWIPTNNNQNEKPIQ